MDFFNNLIGTTPPTNTSSSSSSLMEVAREAAKTPPPPHTSDLTVTSTTWESVVGSVETAGKRVSSFFVVADDAVGNPQGVLMNKLQTLWEDATTIIEDAKSSVEEKITDLQAPKEIRKDPLEPMRKDVNDYLELLEKLKAEVLGFSLATDSVNRIGVEEEGVGLKERVKWLDDSSVSEQFDSYLKIHKEFSNSVLTDVRRNITILMAKIADEVTRAQAVQTRFRRRDKLHQAISDNRGKLEKKKERSRRRATLGVSSSSPSLPDPRVMQEIFDANVAMEEAKKEFKAATDVLVTKGNELLTTKALTFQKLFDDLISIQQQSFLGSSPVGQKLEKLRASIKIKTAKKTADFQLPNKKVDVKGEDADESEGDDDDDPDKPKQAIDYKADAPTPSSSVPRSAVQKFPLGSN